MQMTPITEPARPRGCHGRHHTHDFRLDTDILDIYPREDLPEVDPSFFFVSICEITFLHRAMLALATDTANHETGDKRWVARDKRGDVYSRCSVQYYQYFEPQTNPKKKTGNDF